MEKQHSGSKHGGAAGASDGGAAGDTGGAAGDTGGAAAGRRRCRRDSAGETHSRAGERKRISGGGKFQAASGESAAGDTKSDKGGRSARDEAPEARGAGGSSRAEGRGRGSQLRRAMRISTLDGLFATQYANLTSGTLLVAFLLTLGASDLFIGIVAALPLLGGLAQPVGAEIIRRRGGRRKSVLLGAALADDLLWLVSMAAVVFFDAPTALTVIAIVLIAQQSASAVVGVAWTSWISDLIPPIIRGRFFGRRNVVCHGVGALTAAAAGLVVRAFDRDPLAFVSLIAVGVVFRLISIYYISRQPEPRPARSATGSVASQFIKPLRLEGFRRFLLYGMAWGFAVQLSAPFFTVYMLREAGIGVDSVMIFAALGTASNLVGQRIWGPLCDRYGDHQVMRVAGLSIAMQPFWWLFTGPEGVGFYLMAALSMTGGFAWGGQLLATGNLMMRLAPEMGKTTFFAVQAALGGIFGAAGPLVGGLIAQALAGGWSPVPWPLVEGLKTLFVLSTLLRLAAWGLLHRVPPGVERPRLRAVYVFRDAVRTFNPAQGFSPLMDIFTITDRAIGRRRAARPRQRSSRAE